MTIRKTIPTNQKVVEVRIIRGKDGAPIRTIVERAHSKPTSSVVSLKNGNTQPTDSITERHYMWISECDGRVRSYLAQPFRMEFWFENGDKIVYFPDMERTLEDPAEIEIIEVKKTQSEIFRDPYYAWKISMARKVCKAKGWNFRIVTADKDILPGYLLDNARLVRLDRFTRVTSEDHVRLGDGMEKRRGKMTYGEAVAAISVHNDPWDRDGVAKLHAMIVRRIVCIDLTRPLSQSTLVVLRKKQIWQPPHAT